MFLALSARRATFPNAHNASGIFVVQKHRRQFGLKDNTWRSARELHTYGPVDRAHDAERDTQNGRITDFGARWKKHEVMPTRFTIVARTGWRFVPLHQDPRRGTASIRVGVVC